MIFFSKAHKFARSLFYLHVICELLYYLHCLVKIIKVFRYLRREQSQQVVSKPGQIGLVLVLFLGINKMSKYTTRFKILKFDGKNFTI